MEQVDEGTGESLGTCYNDCSLPVVERCPGSTSTATARDWLGNGALRRFRQSQRHAEQLSGSQTFGPDDVACPHYCT